MRPSRRVIVLAVGAISLSVAAAASAAAATPPAGSWGKAIEVPGLGALNKNGFAEVRSVSCGSAGNCAVGGYYSVRGGGSYGFVAVERGGRWGTAIDVPGLAGLGAGTEVSSVSCGSAGTCAAGGNYDTASNSYVGFVAVERAGRWGTAIEVPGLGRLTKLNAPVTSVSCAPAGTCVAGGWYIDHHNRDQAFVTGERDGRWGKAIEVPGLGGLNKGGDAEVSSVSCGSAGNCAAVGGYADRRDRLQGFVAVESGGRWGPAIEVPGLGALNKGEEAFVDTVSCPSAGNCAVGGSYKDNNGRFRWFVVGQRNGAWGKAIPVPGAPALPRGHYPGHEPLSCGSVGNCAVGGEYYDRRGHRQGFVAVESGGRWGKAIEVPGLGCLNVGGLAFIESVSCPSPGSCAVGGEYNDSHHDSQGFVVSRSG